MDIDLANKNDPFDRFPIAQASAEDMRAGQRGSGVSDYPAKLVPVA